MTKANDLTPKQWDLWHKWTQAQRLLHQAIDRQLQSDFGISKAEFSVLMTLLRAPGNQVRVIDLADLLAWEKSRVSHQLTRMEARKLVQRTEAGAGGRRTGIGLTPTGRQLAKEAVVGHAGNVRRYFFDPLLPEQTAAIGAWSEQMIDLAGENQSDGDVEAA